MKIIIIILQAILNLVRKRRDLIANTDKIPPAIKKSIIAWYSPKKQKLTNYDVIESYAEDFTNWAYRNTRGTAKITNNTIVITNVVETNNIVEDDNKPYSDLTIRVTGVTENKYLIVRQGRGKPEAHIKKDGVYTFKDNNLYFGFGVSVIGECNITITQLPTSILKDFSGNKHDAYLYGFKGKLNSGVGIYAQDFKNWSYGSTINNDISTKSYNKFHIVKKKADNWFGFTIGIPKNNYYNQSYKLKFNINKKIDDIKFSIVSTDGNLITTAAYSVYINDGSIIDVPIISEEIFNNKEETNIYYQFGTNKDIEIDVELIANYPNQLCYAGKQYCKAYGLPIFDDYTIIARRTWFDKDGTFANKGSSNLDIKSLFIFENKANNKTITRTSSFGSWNNVDIPDEGINWQTKNKYNNADIVSGIERDGSDIFTIGGYNSTNAGNWYGYHDDIILLNRSLTVDEINDITKAVFKEDILKPTFDLKATDVIDVVNDRGGELTEYTDIYGVNYTFNNFTLGDAVGNKDYPNALYFTPNKQKIRFAPNKAIKTVIIDGIFYETCVVYDSRDGDYNTNFALYTSNNGENYIAWGARANNAKTYINGELNTTIKGTELYGIRHITAMTKNASSAKVNTINGIDPTFNNKLIIYRITGFDYELTPNQIKNWYEQNKPE
jgi:hypothetical protein